MAPDTPHISFPFRLNALGTSAVAVEQDGEAEVNDCVWVLLSTPLGTRIEVPDYGLPDQTFREGGASLPELISILARWEDRYPIEVSREKELTDLVDRVRIETKGRISA